MSETFKALRVTENKDGTYSKTIEQRSLVDLPAGDVLIRVEYSALNFKDALSAHGNKGVTRCFPHTPGIDAAGVVVSDTTETFLSGERVIVTGYDLGMNTDGGLAEYIRVPLQWCVPCPEGLTTQEAMIYGTAGLTAALCISKILLNGATPSDGAVVVTGASGGVGSLAVSMLSQKGFNVVAVSGKPEVHDELMALGASEVVDRGVLDELTSRAMAQPQWSHGIDCLGGDYLFSVLKSIHYGGSVAACGLAASGELNGNVYPFILRNVNLLGVDSVECGLDVKAAVWGVLANELKLPNLKALSTELTLAQAPVLLDRIYNGGARGRYLVKMTADQ